MLLLACAVALADDGGFDHRHAALDAFLDEAVATDGVRYELLAARRKQLDVYLADLAAAPVGSFSREQQLAFWVNAYNAHTLAVVLDARPLKSILELDGGKIWDTRRFVVGGESLTLNQIEHERIRRLGDGRVHAVVSCASKGCPPLPPDPVLPQGLDEQLDAAMRRWVAHNAYRIDGGQVQLSSIFDWYAEDFAAARKGDIKNAEGKHEAALWFLVPYVGAPEAERLVSGELVPTWAPYDWGLNAR